MRIRAESILSEKKKTDVLCAFCFEDTNVAIDLGKLNKKIDQTILQSVKEINGKKGKISQDDAGKVVKLFNTLKKPQDKAKFQKVISKDLRTIQGLLKRLGR